MKVILKGSLIIPCLVLEILYLDWSLDDSKNLIESEANVYSL